jgi:RNA polymerase sigma factor (sigma-70 family)
MGKHTKRAGGRFLYNQNCKANPAVSFRKLWHIAAKVSEHFRIDAFPREDRENEVFLKLLFCLPRIRKAKNPVNYAWEVARNHLRDLYKREREFGQLPLSALRCKSGDDRQAEYSNTGQIDLLTEGNVTQSWWASRRAEAVTEALNEAVNQLGEREQAILRGYYWAELPFAQIAATLGLSADYVKELKGAAIVKLRNLLSPLDLKAA